MVSSRMLRAIAIEEGVEYYDTLTGTYMNRSTYTCTHVHIYENVNDDVDVSFNASAVLCMQGQAHIN